jgi:hypothetical protein
MIKVDLIEKAELLVGRRVILTFADHVREDWTVTGVDKTNRVISVKTPLDAQPALEAWADYEIDGTDNTYAGAESVPPIVGIEVF